MGATTLARPVAFPRILPRRTLSDERLARLVAEQCDDEAFAILYERYREPLSRYCRSIVRDPEDARDAQQNAMIAALRALRTRPLEGRVKPWLYRIAHNESVTVLRRRRATEPLDEQLPAAGAGADRLESWEGLLLDLRSLPERQRAALLMRELGGLEYDEIAVALSGTPVAARKSVFEARAALSETAAGRSTACEEIRLKISDRDGRALRARRIRGHLDDCASCAAFAHSVRDRRRVLGTIPVLPLSALGLLGGGVAAGAGAAGAGLAGSGLLGSLGGVAAGGGATSALAIKAFALCALCAIAGTGVVLGARPQAAAPHHRAMTRGHAGSRPAGAPALGRRAGNRAGGAGARAAVPHPAGPAGARAAIGGLRPTVPGGALPGGAVPGGASPAARGPASTVVRLAGAPSQAAAGPGAPVGTAPPAAAPQQSASAPAASGLAATASPAAATPINRVDAALLAAILARTQTISSASIAAATQQAAAALSAGGTSPAAVQQASSWLSGLLAQHGLGALAGLAGSTAAADLVTAAAGAAGAGAAGA